ncbi:MAG: TlpA family protein disulfide reductase [Chloroflexia bacterium]|nr:TlpA family protein disulfide reductase [Chloroflexia bacterium]
MRLDAPHDAPVAEAAGGLSQGEPQSRRVTVVLGFVLALVLVAAAWYIGNWQGFEQIGKGGVNLSLLPKIGQIAPDFVTLTAADGRPVRLSDYRGRPVWLNFWGSWCPPCRAEMPELQAAYERLHPRGLALLAVSLNEPAEDAAAFATLNKATFTILSDPRRENTGAAYPIFNFPTHILIDEDGVVRDIVLASIEEEEIVKRAEAILPDDE